ncbi:WD40 repeat domain-containing protein [Streptomyces sp. So13.3]|uniref:WD40 repeat domain-containing protein n=1 Tax=Streptomyces TaxID=1883 RepID=UPI00164EC09E|nr:MULTISPECIES: WD40 repeat domain-containing protein [Streptomyces]MCZ4103508.1 WD40 repeat domain-containing protein [Streptomyces sp. H39-C1]QNA76211.1 WD40 repeat domain-containing protein [Streptomyces sp. So13.3]
MAGSVPTRRGIRRRTVILAASGAVAAAATAVAVVEVTRSSGSDTQVLTGPTGSVYAVAFSPDGKTLASGSGSDSSEDNAIRLWAVSSGRGIVTQTGFPSYPNYVLAVAFSPDGKTLASGGGNDIDKEAGYAVRLWEVATGSLKATLTGHSGRVTSLAFSPDGATLASGSSDTTVRLWDTTHGQVTGILDHPYATEVNAVAFSPDGKTLASGAYASITMWDVQSTTLTTTLSLPQTAKGQEVSSVAFSPDSKILASAGGGNRDTADHSIRLWDLSSGRIIATLTAQPPTSAVNSIAFSPDGKTLASGSRTLSLSKTTDHPVQLREVSSGRITDTLTGHTSDINAVAFSPDGKTLASSSDDHTVRLWKLQ